MKRGIYDKEYHRRWYAKNRESILARYDKEYHQRYYIKNKEKILARKALHWKTHKAIQKRSRLKMKVEVFSYYSKGTPKCKCCGVKELVFLTIDHINGGGRKHLRKHSRELRGGYVFYRWLKKNNYPKGFQILCYNCNCGKRSSKKCPHKLKKI